MSKCRFYDNELAACGKRTEWVAGEMPFIHICDPDCCEDFEYDYYPTIEEIEQEYKEWCINLLKVRFDLKPEFYDEHQHNNFTYENCADCLWNKIKDSIQQLLELRRKG